MGHVNNQPSRRSGSGLWRGALLALCVAVPLWLQGCGGGGGGTADVPPQSPGAATIDTAGGIVTEASGASVVVPANAFTAATTVRIAKDSTGAPALPTGLTPSGDMYMVTPHGGNFAVPVQVSIPVPTVTLLPNQEFKLAKAELGGEWVVLGNSNVLNGKLAAEVSSFSFFTGVVMTYPVALVQAAPIRMVTTLECVGQDCKNLMMGSAKFILSVTVTGTQLPSFCATDQPPELQITVTDLDEDVVDIFPLSAGVYAITYSSLNPNAYGHGFDIKQYCYTSSGYRQGLSGSDYVYAIRPQVAYPGLRILQAPQQLDVINGSPSEINVVLDGGSASTHGRGDIYSVPTSTNRATIDWQRSDDKGGSWRTVAGSFQDEADPHPSSFYRFDADWRVWGVRYGFVASVADHDALIRTYTCYTPSDVPAPPCVTGPSTRINVLQQSALPTIIGAPHSVLVRTGQTASFSATASGTPAPTLQWQSRPANSSGAWANVSTGTDGTTGSYTTGVLAPSDNGLQLRVVATNAVSSVESNPVTVSVSDVDVAPTISTQPGSLTVTTGNDAAFAIAARGTEAMSYQWQYNGAPISGANSPVLRLATVTAGQAGDYRVVVSNAAGTVTSAAATLTVSAGTPSTVAPTIVTQPVAVVVNAGNTATLAVGVSGTGPFVYQWLHDGQVVTGATAAFYSIPSASAGDAGSYSVQVSNLAGKVISNAATLQVNPSTQATAPTLTTQPSPQVQAPGGSATFAVAASGTGPLFYQWKKDAVEIVNATSAVLVVNGIISADAGNYTVTVYNAQGAVTSNAASLTVLGVPAITAQPATATANEGATATFSVQASGTSLGYQWMRNQIAISGATSASYTTPVLALADNGAVYAAVVYNGAGVAVSQGSVLTVTAAPPPPAPSGLTAKAVATGYGSSFAVDLDGTVWAWGYLVDPTTGGYKASSPWAAQPVKIQGLSGVKSITVVSESAAFYALHDDGTVSAWGRNNAGQLGDRTTTTRNLPVPVMLDATNRMTGICKIAGGPNAMVMAPCTAGTVWMVGLLSQSNFGGDSAGGATANGALAKAIPGLPTNQVVRALAMPDAAANALGSLLIVYDNETVFAWGQQSSNTLGAGIGVTNVGTAAGPISVWPAIGSVESADLGRDFTIVQGADLRLKSVGRNLEGQLGIGSYTAQTDRISVNVLDIVSRFSVGQADVAAIQDGQLWVWGWNNGNVLTQPTRLGSEASYTEVSRGDIHGLAIGAGGVVYAWGDGTYGALGNGQSSSTLPMVVPRP